MNIAWWHSFFGTYRYETGPPVPLVHGGLPPNAQDGPRGEVPAWWRVLFRAAFLRTCYVEVGITGSVGVRGRCLRRRPGGEGDCGGWRQAVGVVESGEREGHRR